MLLLTLTLTLMLLMYYEKCTYKSRKCANCFILIIYILLQDLIQNLIKKLLQKYIYHLSNLQSYAFAFLLNISKHVRPICILGSAALPARRGLGE